MLKIIVCDDDERDLNQITELVDEYRSTHQEQPFSPHFTLLYHCISIFAMVQ